MRYDLKIYKHDSAVVNVVVICDQFCVIKRQDVTFLPQQNVLIIQGYLYIALSGLVRFLKKKKNDNIFKKQSRVVSNYMASLQTPTLLEEPFKL